MVVGGRGLGVSYVTPAVKTVVSPQKSVITSSSSSSVGETHTTFSHRWTPQDQVSQVCFVFVSLSGSSLNLDSGFINPTEGKLSSLKVQKGRKTEQAEKCFRTKNSAD